MNHHPHRRTFLKGASLTAAALLFEHSALAHPLSADGTTPSPLPNEKEHDMKTYTAITVPTQFVEANGSVSPTDVGANRAAFRSSSPNTSQAILIIGTPPFWMV